MTANKLVYGSGMNDAGYQVYRNETISGKQKRLWSCPFYKVWTGVLRRCYDQKFQEKWPTYSECSIAREWHSFSSFRAWMIDQPYEQSAIDKDLLLPGNKVYSPETCVFVSGALNNFLTDRASFSGKWPTGVDWHKRSRMFRAACSNPFTGKREYLGHFDAPEEAHEAWRSRKHELACQYAAMQNDLRIAVALSTRYAPRIDAALQAKP